MDEDCASASCNARTHVVINLDDEIVEIVLACQPVHICLGWYFDRPIISSIGGVFAPPVGGGYSLGRQGGGGARMLVGAPPKLPEPENASRRAALAFTLVCLYATPPQCPPPRP